MSAPLRGLDDAARAQALAELAILERAAQEAREAAERAGEPFPPYIQMPVGPKPPEHREPVVDKIAGTVLANQPLTTGQLIQLCSPAKLVLGITAKSLTGAVAEGWTRKAVWGLGRRNHDGALTESVAMRFEHRTTSRGFLLWMWTRTPANVPLLLALARSAARWEHGGRVPRLVPPLVAAVLAALPSTKWTAMPVLGWKSTWENRITQPEPIASSEAKKIIRIGGWA